MPMHHSRQKQYFMRKKYEEYEAKATVVFQFEILSLWDSPESSGLSRKVR